MDRMIYTAMSGAKQSLDRQTIVANNMANVSTPGFRAQLAATRAVPVKGDGEGTRVSAVQTTPGMETKAGNVETTGRPLDVAIKGEGWLAVTRADGSEGYTRDGGLQVDGNGMLLSHGYPVRSTGGEPLVLPTEGDVNINAEGTVMVRSRDGKRMDDIGQLKLVNPALSSLERGDDGLFIRRANPDGSAAAPVQPDAKVRVVSGAIETRNVSAVDAMVSMIDVARRFEMNMKALSTADEDEQKANSLLSIS